MPQVGLRVVFVGSNEYVKRPREDRKHMEDELLFFYKKKKRIFTFGKGWSDGIWRCETTVS